MAVHHNGDVFASSSSGYIQVFNSDGSQKLQIGSPGSGDGQFNGPYGLTIVGEVLYVADYRNYRVQKFTLTGEYILVSLVAMVQVRVSLIVPMVSVLMVGGVS